jgi:hypothetical protein
MKGGLPVRELVAAGLVLFGGALALGSVWFTQRFIAKK